MSGIVCEVGCPQTREIIQFNKYIKLFIKRPNLGIDLIGVLDHLDVVGSKLVGVEFE